MIGDPGKCKQSSIWTSGSVLHFWCSSRAWEGLRSPICSLQSAARTHRAWALPRAHRTNPTPVKAALRRGTARAKSRPGGISVQRERTCRLSAPDHRRDSIQPRSSPQLRRPSLSSTSPPLVYRHLYHIFSFSTSVLQHSHFGTTGTCAVPQKSSRWSCASTVLQGACNLQGPACSRSHCIRLGVESPEGAAH
jgi:hypothetical protein